MKPIDIGTATWTTRTTEGIRTGTWRAALPRHIQAPSPCHAACPVHGDIAEWIGQARAGDLRGAWRTLSRHNPFPATIGRVCHHPCERACNRAEHDEALSICRLERWVGDTALAHGWAYEPPARARSERVAVVGGGPSGLSAAYHLRRRGYAVTVFEAQAGLGGVMRDGIPAYRLARTVLEGEIDRLVALGIEVRCGVRFDDTAALEALRTSFDAVYLAIGARRRKRLRILDYAQPWVMDGAQFLERASRGAAPALGRRVAVIGGGSAAMDVARSARRAGHDVTVLALERRDTMPAQAEEIVEALEEGIVLVDGAMLLDATPGADGLHLRAVQVRAERGADGDPVVTPVPDSGFALAADAIVTAIGQDPELAVFGPQYAFERGLLRTDASGATGVPRAWAGGDVASGARFVSEAIGMGERAAVDIDRTLRAAAGEAVEPPHAGRGAAWPAVTLAAINLHEHPKRPRAASRRRDAAERLAGDAEVQLALGDGEARHEAARCFSCGTCTHCDNCITYCPDLAVRHAGGGYEVLGDYCKGCGVCVSQCPTGSMTMVEELR